MRASDLARNHFADVGKMVGSRHQRSHRVTPRWGLKYSVTFLTQGVAPGYRVGAPLARKINRTKGATPVTIPRTNGAKPGSPGHRPGSPATTHIPSPERAKPNPQARAIKARIAENVVEILEA
jgi:hypothetical protein